jgi:hypothetical protein
MHNPTYLTTIEEPEAPMMIPTGAIEAADYVVAALFAMV